MNQIYRAQVFMLDRWKVHLYAMLPSLLVQNIIKQFAFVHVGPENIIRVSFGTSHGYMYTIRAHMNECTLLNNVMRTSRIVGGKDI